MTELAPVRIDRMQIFDTNVAALRTHIEYYVERGYCVTGFSNHILTDGRIVATMCSAIGKQLGRPWVHIEHREHAAWLTVPMKEAQKHLRTPILIMGKEVEYHTHHQGADVQYIAKKSVFQAYFKGTGLGLLEGWKELVWTDRSCRAALNLPALPR